MIDWVETGEVRPPKFNEWFRDSHGIPKRAMFDFSIQSFPILEIKVHVGLSEKDLDFSEGNKKNS